MEKSLREDVRVSKRAEEDVKQRVEAKERAQEIEKQPERVSVTMRTQRGC